MLEAVGLIFSEMDFELYPDRGDEVMALASGVIQRVVKNGFGQIVFDINESAGKEAAERFAGAAPVVIRGDLPFILDYCDLAVVIHANYPHTRAEQVMKRVPRVLSINFLSGEERWLKNESS